MEYQSPQVKMIPLATHQVLCLSDDGVRAIMEKGFWDSPFDAE